MTSDPRTRRARLTLAGEEYVVLPRGEYERLAGLAKVADLPPLPSRDAEGNYPAIAYARASIARTIMRDRTRAGLTQKDLAKLAGVRVETLCRIEKGRNTPSAATVTKIEEALRRAAGKATTRRKRTAG